MVLIGVLAGHAAGPVSAGYEEGTAAYRRGDYVTAMQELRPLADIGHLGAHTLLGDLYRDGLGVRPDYAEAVRHYRWSSERGHCPAMFALARMYHLGRGADRDHAAALAWYRAAARRGHVWAQFTLASFYEKGLLVPKDDVRAYFWFSLLAAGPRTADDFADTVRRRLAAESIEIIRDRMTSDQIAETLRLVEEWTPDRDTCEAGASDMLRIGPGASQP